MNESALESIFQVQVLLFNSYLSSLLQDFFSEIAS